MKSRGIRFQQDAVDAVVRAVGQMQPAEFAAYPGGWKNEVGTALVDAVFSIRARYATTVEPRLRTLRAEHPEVTNDLEALAAMDERELRRLMGNTKTARRYKAACVQDAARAPLSLAPQVRIAEDARKADAQAVKSAHTSVHGLGWVTAEYFAMLLGTEGVKADRMVQRFVNAALEAAGQAPVSDARTVHDLVVAAHEADGHGVDLTTYEHAIWRAKGALPERG